MTLKLYIHPEMYKHDKAHGEEVKCINMVKHMENDWNV